MLYAYLSAAVVSLLENTNPDSLKNLQLAVAVVGTLVGFVSGAIAIYVGKRIAELKVEIGEEIASMKSEFISLKAEVAGFPALVSNAIEKQSMTFQLKMASDYYPKAEIMERIGQVRQEAEVANKRCDRLFDDVKRLTEDVIVLKQQGE